MQVGSMSNGVGYVIESSDLLLLTPDRLDLGSRPIRLFSQRRGHQAGEQRHHDESRTGQQPIVEIGRTVDDGRHQPADADQNAGTENVEEPAAHGGGQRHQSELDENDELAHRLDRAHRRQRSHDDDPTESHENLSGLDGEPLAPVHLLHHQKGGGNDQGGPQVEPTRERRAIDEHRRHADA